MTGASGASCTWRSTMPGMDSSGTSGISHERCPRESAQGGLLCVVIMSPSLVFLFELNQLPRNLTEFISFKTVSPINKSPSGNALVAAC